MTSTSRITVPGLVGTAFTVFMAALWFFPLYWAAITSLKFEQDTLTKPPGWFPNPATLKAYGRVLWESNLLRWYFNTVFTGLVITFFVLLLCLLCAYAISQLSFPGKTLLYWALLAGFMVPGQALTVPQFILLNDLDSVNTYQGIILPQLIAPIVIIIYKQFFDGIPRDLRDSAIIDGAGEFRILFNIFLPLNWGITWALAIVTFIGAWNAFFWPFIITFSEQMMTIPVGITQVSDAFGVFYARTMAMALLAGLPVIIAYLIFQKRVTEGIMVTAGLKG
ncbi:MAG: carbohydrate ABC transporter permease [Trueperaceae bacterium]|nr:MAG: carbohydrate ABC transporter permease [Trueperaceae bacterium]